MQASTNPCLTAIARVSLSASQVIAQSFPHEQESIRVASLSGLQQPGQRDRERNARQAVVAQRRMADRETRTSASSSGEALTVGQVSGLQLYEAIRGNVVQVVHKGRALTFR